MSLLDIQNLLLSSPNTAEVCGYLSINSSKALEIPSRGLWTTLQVPKGPQRNPKVFINIPVFLPKTIKIPDIPLKNPVVTLKGTLNRSVKPSESSENLPEFLSYLRINSLHTLETLPQPFKDTSRALRYTQYNRVIIRGTVSHEPLYKRDGYSENQLCCFLLDYQDRRKITRKIAVVAWESVYKNQKIIRGSHLSILGNFIVKTINSADDYHILAQALHWHS